MGFNEVIEIILEITSYLRKDILDSLTKLLLAHNSPSHPSFQFLHFTTGSVQKFL